MKKITKILLLFTALFFATSFVNTAHSQCDSATLHTFNGIDSYGDGWNGGSVDILVNGSSVLPSAFSVTGSSGSTTFLAQTGDQITLVWVNGDWPGEISFSISNPNGETIGSGGVSATGPFTASGCPVPAGSCAAPNSLSTTSTTTDSAIVTWADNTVDGSDSFDLEYTDPNGTATTVNDVSSPYTITGLSSNTTYTFNVTSNCATGSETSSDSSFTTSTETLIVSSDCIDFESGSSLYVGLTDNTQSSASYSANAAANSSSYGIILEGGSSGTNWTGGSTSTTEDNAWIDNVLHQSSIDIEVDATSETGVILTFDLKQTYTYGATYSNFRVTVDGTQIGDNLRPTAQTSDEFVNQSYDLSAYAGTSFSLKLEFSGKYNRAYYASGDTAFIDNICITPPPTCPAPTDLSATATSATEATVSWTAGGSETTWEYVVQPAGTGEPTETGSFTTTNPLSLTELTADTAYEIYLRADCGGSPPPPGEFTGSGDTSTWVSATFTTPPSCPAPTGISVSATSPTEATVSWTAGGSEAAWEYVYQAAGTGEPTGAGTATTTNPIPLTGLSSNTDYEIYLRADCGDEFSSWALATFTTPLGCGDSVSYNYGALESGPLYTVSAPNGQYISVTLSGSTEEDYDLVSIEDGSGASLASGLSGSLSGTYESTDGTIVVILESDSSVQQGPAGFAFSCYDPPACEAPTNLTVSTTATEASVSWTAGGSETTWEYVYQAAGTGEPAGSGTATTTNPLTLSGLTASTDYEIYLRADCDGEFSSWALTTFSTPCETYTGAWSHDFDVDNGIPDYYYCWAIVNGGDAKTWVLSTGGNFVIEYSPSGDPHDDYLISPTFSVESGISDRFNFDARNYDSSYAESVDVQVWNSDYSVMLGTLATNVTPGTSYQSYDYDLSAYDGQDIRVAFHITTEYLYYIYIDNVSVDSPDIQAPVITLVGDDPLELSIGDTYTDPGATATDNVDGDLTDDIVVGGDTVSTSASGTFTVTYDVSDAAGNQATQVTRVVNVSCPAPTNLSVSNLAETSVTLNWTSTGTAFMVELQPTGVPQGSGSTYGGYVIGDFEPIPTSYVDLPAGSLPANTSIDFWVVNGCAPGENSTYAGPFTFVTLADTEAPVMSLIGDDPLELNIGDTYTEQGVTITDNIDSGQTLQAALQIGGDTVNTSVAGSYTITYDVSDAAGNQATQVTRVVIVNPALELRGVLDLSLGDTNGKGVHVVVNADIPDLSIYGIGLTYNGNGASAIDVTFPAISVSSGDHILAHANSASVIQAYLGSCYDGFDYVYSGANISINGDDAVELFENGVVIETFGDINVDGSGEDWDYLDSWAYKVDGVWTYGGVNCTDNSTSTSSSNCPYPFCGSDWTGDVSTAWHSDGNWSDGSVPDYTKDVTIATGLTNYPTVSTDASANSVSVATSATLTISENGSLTTTGDFTNAGTVTMNSDSQEFSSLIVGGTSSGDINYNRFVNQYSVPGDDNIQWDLIGSPVDGLEISSFANDNPSLATSGDYFAVGTYDNSTQLWTNYTSATATGVNFDMGLGYQMGTLSGSTLSFEGSVTTATQTQTITDNSGSGGDYWNLVSNPYPSYLNLNDSSDATDNFVSENSVSIYGWNAGSTGAYTVYNQISPTPNTAQYLAPGQGFFVSAEIASQVTFTNAMQTVSGSDDFVSGRMDNAFTYFYLKLNEGDNTVANSMFYFGDGMAYGYDAGYDAEAFSQSTKIMSRALEGNVELGMQVNAMPKEALDDSTVIPLEVNQTAGTAFSIGLTDVVNLAENVEVYLEDTELQTLTDLKVEDYTLNPSYDLSGAGRFYLVFGANSLGGTTIDESYISIYKAANDDFVTIEGLLNVEKANVQLFNIIGQEVLNTTLKTNQSTQRISTTELAAGVYVIKLKADNAVISKKLIIN